jgi:membrane protein YdbS with pleckstrin-like domain
MKSVWPVYFLTVVFYVACVWMYLRWAGPDSENPQPWWLALIPLIVFLFPIRMHLERNSVSLRFEEGDHLTLEKGFLGKTRRTLDMAKIQDVTVRQSFGQRLMGVGDLVLESAGEAGSLGISNVDRPRELADTIIAGSKRSANERARGGF